MDGRDGVSVEIIGQWAKEYQRITVLCASPLSEMPEARTVVGLAWMRIGGQFFLLANSVSPGLREKPAVHGGDG
jgi:hypothetical protein